MDDEFFPALSRLLLCFAFANFFHFLSAVSSGTDFFFPFETFFLRFSLPDPTAVTVISDPLTHRGFRSLKQSLVEISSSVVDVA